MQEEILHLEYNRVVLILKAMNIKPNFESAAQALGITEQTLKFYVDAYKIKAIRGGNLREFIAERWPKVEGVNTNAQPQKEYTNPPKGEVDTTLLAASLPSTIFL